MIGGAGMSIGNKRTRNLRLSSMPTMIFNSSQINSSIFGMEIIGFWHGLIILRKFIGGIWHGIPEFNRSF